MEFSVQQARNQLSHLIDLARNGESVVITRHGKPVVQLSSVSKKRRKLGSEAHLGPLPDGWDKPMSKKEAAVFLGISK